MAETTGLSFRHGRLDLRTTKLVVNDALPVSGLVIEHIIISKNEIYLDFGRTKCHKRIPYHVDKGSTLCFSTEIEVV